MSIDTSAEFGRFHSNISLTETQVGRIESARTTLKKYLIDEFDLTSQDVILQGSYANGTAIKPLSGGEYDVDIVVVSATFSDTADEALIELARTLKSNGNYKDKVREKKPCIRLEYADDHIGGFHVDVVPTRPSTDAEAPLDAPRRGEGWHPTAPEEYTTWCANQGEAFLRTVQFLKRWRDEQQDVRHGIKSIVLQVLIASHLGNADDDAERIFLTFSNLHEYLKDFSAPPAVYNPALSGENLARRWDQESFDDFKKALEAAVEISKIAVETTDKSEACESWRSLFGESFPQYVTKGLSSMTVADTSHAENVNGRGWYELIDSRYELSVSTSEGRNTAKMKAYASDSRLLFAGKKLKFKANVSGPSEVQIWWRVTNTGKHARDVNGLRGKFQRAQNLNKKPSQDQSLHWESTAYTGSHVVEAYAVLGQRVVAKSQQTIIRIHKAGMPWAW